MAIKKLQNNFTTPEQSKRLLELGIPANSADCYYENFRSDDPDNIRLEIRQNIKEVKDNLFKDYTRLVPCWSVGRLIEIMKVCSIPVTTWYIKSNSKQPLLEYFMDDLESALMERDIDFSKLED